MALLRRFARFVFLGIVALILVFEEWGWEPLSQLVGRLARLPVFAWLEARIRTLSPWPAAATFLVPAAALLPVKLLALFLMAHGQTFWGVAVLLGAKVLGTALLARLFTLTQPSLMRLRWFAYAYPRWKRWKDTLIAHVHASVLWQGTSASSQRLRLWWADFCKRHGE